MTWKTAFVEITTLNTLSGNFLKRTHSSDSVAKNILVDASVSVHISTSVGCAGVVVVSYLIDEVDGYFIRKDSELV